MTPPQAGCIVVSNDLTTSAHSVRTVAYTEKEKQLNAA